MARKPSVDSQYSDGQESTDPSRSYDEERAIRDDRVNRYDTFGDIPNGIARPLSARGRVLSVNTDFTQTRTRWDAFLGNAYCQGLKMSSLVTLFVLVIVLAWLGFHPRSCRDAFDTLLSWGSDKTAGQIALFTFLLFASTCIGGTCYHGRRVTFLPLASSRANDVVDPDKLENGVWDNLYEKDDETTAGAAAGASSS